MRDFGQLVLGNYHISLYNYFIFYLMISPLFSIWSNSKILTTKLKFVSDLLP